MWLVLQDGGDVVGYAYGSPFKSRSAHRWSCEVSIYLELGRRRTGGGRLLYKALLSHLAEQRFRTALAGMTLPDEASAGLHRALGVEPVGTYRRIGWKHGSWQEVAWGQRSIGTDQDPPAESSESRRGSTTSCAPPRAHSEGGVAQPQREARDRSIAATPIPGARRHHCSR